MKALKHRAEIMQHSMSNFGNFVSKTMSVEINLDQIWGHSLSTIH